MLLIIGLVILALVLCIKYLVLDIAYEWREGIVLGGLSILITVLVFFGALGLASLIGLACPTHYTHTDTYQLVAFKDHIGTGGTFFIGCGTIETEPYYFFYKKEDFGYKMGKIKTEKTVIIEDNRSIKRIEKYKEKISNVILRKVAIVWREKYKVYIPERSIAQGYRLDLE